VDVLIEVGNRAYVSGIVTQAPQDPGALGQRIWFAVIDNGNGNSGLADELGILGGGLGDQLTASPIFGGNLKVR
jgi:hypothetical protein